MKFCEYNDTWNAMKKIGFDRQAGIKTREEFFYWHMREIGAADPYSTRHQIFEFNWSQAGRPYYDVYPSVIPMLTKIDLSKVKVSDIPKPAGLSNILIRLPDSDHQLQWGRNRVRTVFVAFQRELEVDTFCIGIDFGERVEDADELTVCTIKFFHINSKTVSEQIDSMVSDITCDMGVVIPDEVMVNVVRLCVTICLLNNNPELVSPEVLSRDCDRVTDDNLEAMIERAKRRGKFAFSVGKSIETIPHFRRPHPALCWTETGRKVPRIVMRKGSVVHREKVLAVPTGFDGGSE